MTYLCYVSVSFLCSVGYKFQDDRDLIFPFFWIIPVTNTNVGLRTQLKEYLVYVITRPLPRHNSEPNWMFLNFPSSWERAAARARWFQVPVPSVSSPLSFTFKSSSSSKWLQHSPLLSVPSHERWDTWTLTPCSFYSALKFSYERI